MNSERGSGGSNPPLSAFEPSETDRNRLNPLVSGTSVLGAEGSFVFPTRREPTLSDPDRPPTATVSATAGATVPPDLATVIEAWSDLPEVLRAGILAMVKSAKGQEGGR